MTRFHILSAVFICIAMLFVRVMGVHGHIAQGHDEHQAFLVHEQVESHHDHAVATFVSSHDIGHELAHLNHGEMELDVDPPLSLTSKLPSIGFVALVCTVLGLLLWPIRQSFSNFAEPPPRRMWRRYLLPLAHAPPIAR
jgi:hypothetical protein